MTRLVLASASPARRALLRSAGIDAVVAVSGVDEEEVLARAQERDGRIAPADAALLLAQAKAEAVDLAVRRVRDEDAAARADGDPPIVLGCDSVLELDGEAYGKPSDAAVATARWRRMRGRSGVLHTGHWVVRGPRMSGATSSTVVHFADVTDAEIEAYVATGEPLAVAGGFTVDGYGGPFVRGVEGDHHGVVGLSLPLLRDLLAQVGVEITALWRPPGRTSGDGPCEAVTLRAQDRAGDRPDL